MTKRMFIDAVQNEETRVAVVSGKTLERFDCETFHKQNLRGNIYLATVIRVEPSLQAAFVAYGENRHGFLPFTEINPDYFRVPMNDRKALAAEIAESHEHIMLDEEGDLVTHDEDNFELNITGDDVGPTSEEVDTTSAEIEKEEKDKKRSPYRQYKIQEVINKGQIMLIQAVKEERGTKGAAFTSYISLAGRYCVLMPNSRRGGGISKKISKPQDRTRLKKILDDLGIVSPMGLIVRTAGQGRNKTELRRDVEYLQRLWNQIREKMIDSKAPQLVHKEGNLIQKSIRDIYSKEIQEILVQGKEGYTEVKAVMKSFMPSHMRRIKEYKGEQPILQEARIEEQIDSLYSPITALPSGGSLVISTTEALTAIDINSGRSTRDRHIDETAYHTNLEATEGICRQLILRDISGLVVIDFIDMENKTYILAVERKMKELLAKDYARTQHGRIAQFGLYSLSRQRIGPSFVETSTHMCPHCFGSGLLRSSESQALQILRQLEAEARSKQKTHLIVFTASNVTDHLLNTKRHSLLELEKKFDIKIDIRTDNQVGVKTYRIENATQTTPMDSAETTLKESLNKEPKKKNRHLPAHNLKKKPKTLYKAKSQHRRSNEKEADNPTTQQEEEERVTSFNETESPTNKKSKTWFNRLLAK